MGRMPRPLWTGAISFGLVSIPVRLYNAVSKKSVSFNQLDDRTMSRIRYRKVSADSGDEVPDDHIVKGYEVSKGQYVVVEPDELEQFMPVATHSIDLDEFVDLADIDPMYFDTAYYLAPDKVTKPYALLVKAMEEAGKVAVGRFVMRNKQHVAAIRAVDGHLVLSTMVYPDELVSPAAIDEFEGLEDVDVSSRELQMAEQLVESLAGPFEPEKYRDEYREQVLDLIGKKAAGEELVVPEPAETAPKVVDLLAALEASVQAAKESRTRHPTARPAKAAKAAKSAKASEAEEQDEAPARTRRKKSA
jgi:DNA end-binding protein Ku